MSSIKAKAAFTDIFKMRISDFMEYELTAALGKVLIDVIKFDEWLHKKHGDYEARGLTMSTLIIQEYGQPAEELITRLVLGT